MSAKTSVDVSTGATTSLCCSEKFFFSEFLVYMFPVVALFDGTCLCV
jgi:positive regulator of sigma E activity